MDRVDTIAKLIQEAIKQYIGPLYKGSLYAISDSERECHALLAIPDAHKAFKPSIILFVRIVGDRVIIDVDSTDRPFADALVDAGVAREAIILGYAGEAMPA